MAQLTGAISVQVIYRADSAVGPLYWANRYEAYQKEVLIVSRWQLRTRRLHSSAQLNLLG